jgi:hypothetical protein
MWLASVWPLLLSDPSQTPPLPQHHPPPHNTMSAKPCTKCGKNAYPLESLKAGDDTYHKLCFKCAECNVVLNLNTFKKAQGNIYCATCTPKPKATAVADDVRTKSALSASPHTQRSIFQNQSSTSLPLPPPPLRSFIFYTSSCAHQLFILIVSNRRPQGPVWLRRRPQG